MKNTKVILAVIAAVFAIGYVAAQEVRTDVRGWFEENWFGKAPLERPADETFGETNVMFAVGRISIPLEVQLPERLPAPVIIQLCFGDEEPLPEATKQGFALVRWQMDSVARNPRKTKEPFNIALNPVFREYGPKERTDTSWGSVAAWAWGFRRVVDWVETRPELDSKRITVVGFSRAGKAALWAGAQDERIALTVSCQSGCGGAMALKAHAEGAETLERLGVNFPNWMAGRLYAMAGKEDALEYDAPDLLKLFAPRKVLVLSANDAKWLGSEAEQAAAKEAGVRHWTRPGKHSMTADDWQEIFKVAKVMFCDDGARSRLYEDFVNPPSEAKVGCYYYWVNERVDPVGVRKDLEWMKSVGITRAFLCTDIRNRYRANEPFGAADELIGDNEFWSDKWWENLRTALKVAGELGIEMGLFNCPGWSQSGGPWIKPEESMRDYNPTNCVGWEVCRDKWDGLRSNGPCSPKATGLEVDKLSATHVRKHFDSFIGEILRRIPAEDRKTFTTVVIDSWERGTQNYTDDIFERFKARFGYDLNYADAKCQKDLKTLLAELVASEYIGTMTECAHENGLITWCEPYAHSSTIMDGVTYGMAADEVAAEFWAGEPKNERTKEVNSALWAARRRGKNRIYAESFTAGRWERHAKDDWSFESLKPYADKFFHKGINATILHVVISQPGDDTEPPVRPWFGTFFDRRSKNAADTKRLVDYCRRCNFMLQAGKPHEGKTDERILDDGTIIRFTPDSLFEVTFPDGRKETWNPEQPKEN